MSVLESVTCSVCGAAAPNSPHVKESKAGRRRVTCERCYFIKKVANPLARYHQQRAALMYGEEGKWSGEQWADLVQRYEGKCVCCGSKAGEGNPLTPDHVVPLAMGGANTIENLQPLCWRCNTVKGARCVDYRSEAVVIS